MTTEPTTTDDPRVTDEPTVTDDPTVAAEPPTGPTATIASTGPEPLPVPVAE